MTQRLRFRHLCYFSIFLKLHRENKGYKVPTIMIVAVKALRQHGGEITILSYGAIRAFHAFGPSVWLEDVTSGIGRK